MPDIKANGKYHWDPEKQGESKRPFRLYDAQKKRNMPHRNYGTAHNAHDAALIEVRWAAVGHSIEVYDCRASQRSHGTYTRKVNSISFVPSGGNK